jgi:hypothetical protein
LQVLVLDYLVVKARPDVFWFAIPNAGLRSLRMGARMRQEGMRAGVADLCLMLPFGRCAWLEMKANKGRQSTEQKGFEARCQRLGHPYAVAKSFDEAVEFLSKVGALK